MTRKNLRLRLGDIVTVHQAPDVKYATVVHVLPYAEDLEGVTGETFETFLQPFFEGEFKPVSVAFFAWCFFCFAMLCRNGVLLYCVKSDS